MRTSSLFAAVVTWSISAHALFEVTYHSSPLAIQPFTILSKDPSYDPDNTTLFLACPHGSAVVQSGPTIYTSTGDLVWSDPSFAGCNDLNIQNFDGEQFLTLWFGVGSPLLGTGNGVAVMLNSQYEIVRNVTAVNPENTDIHEFNIVKPENRTALVTAYHPIQADLSSVGGLVNGWYLNAIIQEIDIATGDVLFNWTSFDHIALNESFSSPVITLEGGNATNAWDAVHINSIDKDTNGDYLISARHCQTIYKIAKNGTILWRLGGKNSDFTSLTENTEFHWQHHARWREDETIISLFDDEGAALSATAIFVDGTVATGKYLAVDQTAMTISLVNIFSPAPETGVSLAEGSIEPYGSTVLVGYGSNPWVQAYTSSSPSSLLFSAIIGPNDPLLWEGGIANYRAFQTSTLQFVGHPTQPPSVAVVSNSTVTGSGKEVFVSWNGATHVGAYDLFTGDTALNVEKFLRRAAETGFETALSGQGISNFVRVEAIAKDGGVLGRSKVYKTSDGSVVN